MMFIYDLFKFNPITIFVESYIFIFYYYCTARDPQTHLGLGPWTPTLRYDPQAQPFHPKLDPVPAKAIGSGLMTLRPAQNPLNEPL